MNNFPSRETCFKLLKKQHTPKHIIRHTLAVTAAAAWLCDKFSQAGITVNAVMVERACLLHDLTRVSDIHGKIFNFIVPEEKTVINWLHWKWQQLKYRGVHHNDSAAEIIRAQGYMEIAELVRKHGFDSILAGELNTWEEKIVFYADKRINLDQLVSLEARIKEGEKRWRKMPPAKKRHLISALANLEQEIFLQIKVKPEALRIDGFMIDFPDTV